MRREARRDRALFLAAVAAGGLVVAPLLHAEQHLREAEERDAERSDVEAAAALADSWKAGSSDPLEALAIALARGHRSAAADRRDTHHHDDRGEHHHHSHGAQSGPHGAGALAHFGFALHATAHLPQVALPPPDHTAPAAVVAQLRATLAYLVPQWSRGPPELG
jgi:hypothetical protein